MNSGNTSKTRIPLVVDVRSPGEYACGHVAGSINVPLDSLPQRAADVLPERDAPLVLCCLSGARSGLAVQWLKAQGYRQVTNGGSVGGVALQLGRPIEQS
jgi:phage shock protein E